MLDVESAYNRHDCAARTGRRDPAGPNSDRLRVFPVLADDPERVTFKANISTAPADILFATIRVPFEAD